MGNVPSGNLTPLLGSGRRWLQSSPDSAGAGALCLQLDLGYEPHSRPDTRGSSGFGLSRHRRHGEAVRVLRVKEGGS